MARSQAWKEFERRISKLLARYAGPVTEERLTAVMTSTGRAGPNYGLQVDFFAGEYPVAVAGECKRRQMTKMLREELLKIVERAFDYGRMPMYCFSFSSDLKQRVIKRKGKPSVPIPRDWCAVPAQEMAELLAAKRYLKETNLYGDYLMFITDHLGPATVEDDEEEPDGD